MTFEEGLALATDTPVKLADGRMGLLCVWFEDEAGVQPALPGDADLERIPWRRLFDIGGGALVELGTCDRCGYRITSDTPTEPAIGAPKGTDPGAVWHVGSEGSPIHGDCIAVLKNVISNLAAWAGPRLRPRTIHTAGPFGRRPALRGYRSPHGPKFTVHVDRKMWAAAERRKSSHCMAAAGIKKARPEASRVSVDLQTIRFTEGDRRFIYLTPRQVQVALVRFDQGVRMDEELTFTLRGPQSIPAQKKGESVKRERARLSRPTKASRNSVPVKVGGSSPPKFTAPGKTRTFGLRSLHY